MSWLRTRLCSPQATWNQLGTLLGVFEGSIPFDGSMNSPPLHPGSAATKAIGPLNLAEHEAVLSDLDGVITKTARLHAAAWKRLFDAYLAHVAAQTGTIYTSFDLEEDYRLHLDGKPRHDGVRDFLKSRGLSLPLGDPSDRADRETLYGMGNQKDTYFEAALRETGVFLIAHSIEEWAIRKTPISR